MKFFIRIRQKSGFIFNIFGWVYGIPDLYFLSRNQKYLQYIYQANGMVKFENGLIGGTCLGLETAHTTAR